ncbi:cytochrome c1 [Candidatus Lariskella endosymbiont of Hedychridium roseum]|uniref:cytochrome c1 n=1 Tax=Candidatus Lariskella endosymbiont of Hedychridium roseum TaxID=3077949 RepID=UPI003977D67E
MLNLFSISVRALFCFFLIACCAFSISLASEHIELKKEKWKFDGPFGTFDRQAIQRGFKVYREVCSACHAVSRLSFRNLMEIGFSKEEADSIASDYTVEDGPDDSGAMFQRPAKIFDHLPAPFENEKAARAANNGAYPPDLSLIIKAREGDADYVYSILTGYKKDVPPSIVLGDGMHYNPYFQSEQIAMPPPLLSDGQVDYTDGTNPTIDQMAMDVVNFLQWVAEPEMEQRKSLGVRVIIFTIIFTLIMYLAKRRIWSRLHKKD